MLLSRFWYLVLAFALGGAVAVTFVSISYYNRNAERWAKDALAADSSAVGWYLKDDARNHATALLPIALDASIREGLGKADDADDVPKDVAKKVQDSLVKLSGAADPKFTAVLAVDADGRVIGETYFQQQHWNIGGYSVVADALAGWIRDDAWVLDGKIYRVVARPVERDGGGEPLGAIVGLTVLDDNFADAVAQRTNTVVAFYALGVRSATGIPDQFKKPDYIGPDRIQAGDLDTMQGDLAAAIVEQEYMEKGRSKVRRPVEEMAMIYARLSGEASELGSGFVVARKVSFFKSPLQFLDKVEKQDTTSVPLPFLIAGALGVGLLGIIFSVLEHTLPLRTFKKEATLLSQGKVDQLAPSRFRGAFKKIAADINDGIDKIAAKGGAPRRAADLESVIGPIPAQPMMSAFAVPDAGAAPAPEKRVPTAPKPRPPVIDDAPPPSEEIDPQSRSNPGLPARPPPPPRPRGSVGGMPAVSADADDSFDELADWKKVFEEYVAVRKRCGEPTDTLTFEKFKATLERNKAALVERHNCTRVKFTVYEKDGKAALKASPMK